MSVTAVVPRPGSSSSRQRPLSAFVHDRASMRRMIVKQGYLKKLPNSSKLGSSLKKPETRWFVFGVINGTDPYLEYYQDEDSIYSASPINMFLLDSCERIVRDRSTVRHQHMFTLVLRDRHLSLCAENRQVMFDWCKSFEQQLKSLKVIESQQAAAAAGAGGVLGERLLGVPEHDLQPRLHQDQHQQAQAQLGVVRAERKKNADSDEEESDKKDYENMWGSGGRHLDVQGGATGVQDGVVSQSREAAATEGAAAAPESADTPDTDQYCEPVRLQPPPGRVAVGTLIDLTLPPPVVSDEPLVTPPGTPTTPTNPHTPPATTPSHNNGATPQRDPSFPPHFDTPSCRPMPPAFTDLPSSPPPMPDIGSPMSIPASPFFPMSPEVCTTDPSSFEVLSPKMREALGMDDDNNMGTTDEDAIAGWNMPPPDEHAPPDYMPRGVLDRGANKSLKLSQVEQLRKEIENTGGVHMTLRKLDVFHAVATVDIDKAVWVAGWNHELRSYLQTVFHIGDQIVSINGQVIESTRMAHKLIKHCSDSDQINFMVRRTPRAKVFALKREESGQDLGLRRQGGSAEIIYVEPHSLAYDQGMPAKAVTMSGDGFCSWWLTEINGRALSLAFKGDEIEKRLNAVGKDISLMIQPTDFMRDLKRKLKVTYKNYKEFYVL